MRDPLGRLFDEPSPEIRIGTQGMSAGAWEGSFYPPGMPAKRQLGFYADVFDTVELNTTYYSIPSERTVRSWYNRTPDNFIFAAKFPQIITHEKWLVNCQQEVESFLKAMNLLGEKLGPLLIQLHPDFSAENYDDLGRFLTSLPTREFKFVVEVRNRKLQTQRVLELLEELEVGWCITHWRNLPVKFEFTTETVYIRLVGWHNEFGAEELDRERRDRTREARAWANSIEWLKPKVGKIYVYVNNHYSGHAPATCNQLKQALGLEWVEPISLWPKIAEQAQMNLGLEELDPDLREGDFEH